MISGEPPQPFAVAIDGPASSGKSSVGARLAHDLGLPFLDTGLLYRAVGVAVPADRADDVAAAVAAARALDHAGLNAHALAGEEVAERASRVSAMPEVREALFELQRTFALQSGGAVVVGRDIGTAVVPEAPAKIFITASLAVRAERRLEQLRARGGGAIPVAVLAELRRRDERDATRSAAPLAVAWDAFLLDTTRLCFEATVRAARSFIDERAARARRSDGSRGVGATST